MKNFIQPGNTIPLTMPAAVLSGDPVRVGSIFGVASRDGASGEAVDCSVVGVFSLPKATGAITQGAILYWDGTAKKVTTSAASGANPKIGAAIAAAVSGAATVPVRLDGISA